MSGLDILLLVVFIVAAVVFGIFMLNRWVGKKVDAQNTMLEQHKMTQQAYIISKKRDKITNVKMPKAVMEQVPNRAKLVKMNFVQVKIGPQIVTLIAYDKNLFDQIPLKKNVSLEISGIYITGMKGMKTNEEIKEIKKEKKAKAKEKKKAEKAS